MKKSRNKLSTILTVASVIGIFLGSSHAFAGKIYMNGEWKNIPETVKPLDWSNAFSFGSTGKIDITALAKDFLNDSANSINSFGEHVLSSTTVIKGEVFDSVKIQKSWNAIPVIGGETILNYKNGQMIFGNADGTALDSLIETPTIKTAEAASIAFSSYRGNASSTSKPELKVLLLGSADQKVPYLAYEVTVEDRDEMASDIHYIDAHTGRELMTTSNIETLLDRQVISASGTDDDLKLNEQDWTVVFSDRGCKSSLGFPGWFPSFPSRSLTKNKTLSLNDLSPPNPCNRPADAAVLASATGAWINSTTVYNYYLNNHNRDSIDGSGMQIKSVVNFGNKFNNAAWVRTRSIMIYGMGDGENTNDFASSLDVAGHELTHGITARTASLQYADESGSLNESYSDVFGKLVAFKNGSSRDWKLGKELFRDGTRFVRDMENPKIGHVRNYKYRGETCSRANDFCGVHINSGITNKAAVIIASQIGLDNLAKLYYVTLTQLLRTSSNFKEARAQTEAACGSLFGASGSECSVVASAYDQVGITK